MDKMLSVHSKNTNKQLKTKKKPVKVVHISNPMKFNTSASEFRALVQELTGQDSVIQDPSKYSETVGRCSVDYFINECDNKDKFKKGFVQVGHGDKVVVEHHQHEVEVGNVYPNTSTETAMTDNSDLSFEEYAGVGEDYVPELLENLPGFMTTNMWYD